MRISADPEDTSYDPKCHLEHYVILVDGNRMEDVLTADSTLGEVIYYAKDERGRFLVGDNGDVVLKCRRGFVEIQTYIQ